MQQGSAEVVVFPADRVVQGVGAGVAIVVAQQQFTAAVLSNCPPGLRPDVLSLYAEWTGLAGSLAWDARDHATSARLYTEAHIAATAWQSTVTRARRLRRRDRRWQRCETGAVTLLELERALIQLDEIEEAADVVGHSAELTDQNRSPRLAAAIIEGRHQLAPWADSRSVHELDQRLTARDIVVA